MTATNINIEEFLAILMELRKKGSKYINLDMLPDENNPKMNKLQIHAVKPTGSTGGQPQFRATPKEIVIRNPEIRTDNDDIFNLFDGLV